MEWSYHLGIFAIFGINQREENSIGISGAGVAVIDESGKLRWASEFGPGYGLTSLETDVTNHVFATFAITNHTGLVWALRITQTDVESFGTTDGSRPIDSVGQADFNGVKPLYSYREGWPANTQNELTSRDVFVWNGSTYDFAGCEVLGQLTHDDPQIVEKFDQNSQPCSKPIGISSLNLDGSRPNSIPPP